MRNVTISGVNSQVGFVKRVIIYDLFHYQIIITALAEKGFEIVSVYNNRNLFLDHIKKFKPLFCLLSCSEPGKNSIELIKAIHEISPLTNIVIALTESYIQKFGTENLNVSGIVRQNCSSQEISMCLETILEGFRFIPKYDRINIADREELTQLTSQELKIFNIISKGTLKNHEIADKLFLSPHTVKNHKQNLIKKLGLSGVQELYQIAYRNIQVA